VPINREQKMTPSLEWALQVHSLEEIQRYRTLVLHGDLADCLGARKLKGTADLCASGFACYYRDCGEAADVFFHKRKPNFWQFSRGVCEGDEQLPERD
jgi:hypothetical protein